MEHAKNFRFLGKVCKRPASTYIRPTSKKCKKARKTGKCRSMYLIFLPYAREKKSKNFFYIERYVNDLHRPTSFFHGVEERRFSIQKTEDGMLIQHTPNLTQRRKFSLFWKGLQTTCIDPHSTYIKKRKKARKTGRWRS